MSVIGDAMGKVTNVWEQVLAGPVGSSVLGLGGASSAADTSRAGGRATDASLSQLAYQQQASEKLNTLISDPSQVTTTGGYKSGMEAVMRGLAQHGYVNSGNEMTALAEFGQNFYTQQVQLLQSLASGMPSTVNAINTGTSVQSSGMGGMGSILSMFGGGGGGNSLSGLMGLFGGGGAASSSVGSIGGAEAGAGFLGGAAGEAGLGEIGSLAVLA